MAESGFTLQEILITCIALAILMAVAITPYQRTIERNRWRAARDILEAIYAGEQVYQTTDANNWYCSPTLPPADPNFCDWSQIYMDTPAATNLGVTFTVAMTGGGVPQSGFTATASRGGVGCTSWTVSIDNTRVIGGTALNAVCP